jgi:serine/threonine-protein kinase
MMTFEQRLKEMLSATYDIERELGGGGMSRVFVAVDRSLGRKVVIKLLSPELTAEVNRGRFRREIQVAAQLQHPHIVPLLSAGEHEDVVWYTMPFISGESLKSAIEKKGPMPVNDVVRVMYHVGEALDYAHGEGVVHRDIKPANILRSGTYALVTDFGVAKALNAAMSHSSGMTATGTAVGTPAYMAPEQLAGEATADHRIDIYALGLLAYELLKGKSPFSANTAQRVLVAVLTEMPEPLIELRPDVPRGLSDIVMRCLEKDPGDRPATARELLDELDRFSTASGEIRTTEHKIPRRTPPAPTPTTTPTPTQPQRSPEAAAAVTPALAPTGFIDVRTPEETEAVTTPEDLDVVRTPESVPVVAGSGEIATAENPDLIETYSTEPRPRSNRTKMIVGGLALLIPVVAGAIFLSRSGGSKPAPLPPAPAPVAPVVDSTNLPPAAIAPVAPVSPVIDSQAIKDSLKRADSLKKVAKAAALKKAQADSLRKADSVKKALAQAQAQAQAAQESNLGKARRAASVMLSNAYARGKFNEGATHQGGVLGTRKKGDLQTQIDAITPFLRQAGLTYEQFKAAVTEAGVKLYDSDGRMLPNVLEQFAGGH